MIQHDQKDPLNLTFKPSFLVIILLIILGIAGLFVIITFSQLENERETVSLNKTQMQVYKATFWTIETRFTLTVDVNENATILFCVLTEKNFEKQTAGETPVYVINHVTEGHEFEFTPEFGKTYYLEVGNTGLSDITVEVNIPKAFEIEGKIGMPDSELY
jgi:hypothetical protein